MDLMNSKTKVGTSKFKLPVAALMVTGLLLAGSLSCSLTNPQPAGRATSTLPAAPTETQQIAEPATQAPTATMGEAPAPSGWETYTSPRFAYAVSHPPEMEGSDNGEYSWTLSFKLENPDEGARNFIYVSAIPAGFQNEPGAIYNYDPAETDILMGMQVGESKSLRDDTNTAQWFTYTRKPDATIADQPAQVYENIQPWEFPAGTKELRYYLQAGDFTYLIGGYLDSTGSNQPGAITEELFTEIISTFRLAE
jgi:hypothetical protein